LGIFGVIDWSPFSNVNVMRISLDRSEALILNVLAVNGMAFAVVDALTADIF